MQGHFYSSKTGQLERYYKPVWAEPGYMPTAPLDLKAIRVRILSIPQGFIGMPMNSRSGTGFHKGRAMLQIRRCR